MQMELSQVNYCDFVLWREGENFHQRILLDKYFTLMKFFRKMKLLLKWPFCLSSLANGLAVNYSTRHNFFTIRIINLWNNLPESIISVDSVSLFKKKLDDHWNHLRYGHNQRPRVYV